ncbi:MAG: NADPH:quinone reductase [Blastocatellia bacterium]|nr:NADPH:quinone reductase [Blastocatellia bacterium]
MKAIVVREFGGPEVMTVEESADLQPSDVEVHVKIEAAGVNPVDTYIRGGQHTIKPSLPYTPGKDGAGVVEAVGAGVKNIKPGDRVYTADSISGTYAEYALCREDQVAMLPYNVSFEQGAGVFTPYATAYRALFQKAQLIPGEKVLVHGASGAVGIAAVQWAKRAGAIVIGTASSEEGMHLAQDEGADHVFDHSDPDHFEAINDATHGGVDVIIEMLANENLERDFGVLKKFGRVVIVGSRGSINLTPRLAMTKEATIHGMVLFNATQDEFAEIRRGIYDGLSAEYLRPIVRRSYPLSEAADAHREIIESKACGKIVLVP